MQEIHRITTTTTGAGKHLQDRRLRPHNHHHPALKCPRCDSLNTKFCYYNNYNLSQPRHFCKNCRRYWTKGGVLRNIPVGGGCRKTKQHHRHSKKPPTTHSHSTTSENSSTTSNSAAAVPTGAGLFPMSEELLLFSSDEIGGFMNLMENTTNTLNTDPDVNPDPNPDMYSGILDPMVRIDELTMMQNRGSNDDDAGLFDFGSNVDHQSYWNQTTSSQLQHHEWSNHANNDHTLFLP